MERGHVSSLTAGEQCGHGAGRDAVDRAARKILRLAARRGALHLSLMTHPISPPIPPIRPDSPKSRHHHWQASTGPGQGRW